MSIAYERKSLCYVVMPFMYLISCVFIERGLNKNSSVLLYVCSQLIRTSKINFLKHKMFGRRSEIIARKEERKLLNFV